MYFIRESTTKLKARRTRITKVVTMFPPIFPLCLFPCSSKKQKLLAILACREKNKASWSEEREKVCRTFDLTTARVVFEDTLAVSVEYFFNERLVTMFLFYL